MNNFRSNIFELSGIGFLLFFFIYGIHFTFLPTYTSQLIALSILILWGIKWYRSGNIELQTDRNSLYIFFLWFFLFIWILFRTVDSGFRDFGFLVNISLLFTQVFMGSLFFSIWFFKRGFSFDFMIRIIQIVIVIQGVFIIIYFLSPAFKHFTLEYIPEGGNVPALHPFRSRGLTHQAGASLAAFQATGMLLTSYLITKKISWEWTVFDIIGMVILLGSVMLTGRTGFIIFPFIAVYFTLFILFRNGVTKKMAYAGMMIPFLGIGAFFLVQFIFQTYTGTEGGTGIFRAIGRWMFGEFQDLGQTGSSRTIDVLLNEHWFFPESMEVFLFGDPNTYMVNRVNSDIGIIRRIFGIGLIGISLTYLLVFSILYQAGKSANNVSERLLILCFGVWLFILELKEPFVTDLRFSTIYMMMFCYICLMPVQKLNRFRLSNRE